MEEEIKNQKIKQKILEIEKKLEKFQRHTKNIQKDFQDFQIDSKILEEKIFQDVIEETQSIIYELEHTLLSGFDQKY